MLDRGWPYDTVALFDATSISSTTCPLWQAQQESANLPPSNAKVMTCCQSAIPEGSHTSQSTILVGALMAYHQMPPQAPQVVAYGAW